MHAAVPEVLGEPETARRAHVGEGAVEHDGVAGLHAAPSQHVRPHARERCERRGVGVVAVDEVGIEVPGALDAAGREMLGLSRIDDREIRPGRAAREAFRPTTAGRGSAAVIRAPQSRSVILQGAGGARMLPSRLHCCGCWSASGKTPHPSSETGRKMCGDGPISPGAAYSNLRPPADPTPLPRPGCGWRSSGRRRRGPHRESRALASHRC